MSSVDTVFSSVLVELCPSVTFCVLFCVSFQDEGALVRAARNLGFVFSGRTPDSVIVEMVREDSWMGSQQAILLMDGLS